MRTHPRAKARTGSPPRALPGDRVRAVDQGDGEALQRLAGDSPQALAPLACSGSGRSPHAALPRGPLEPPPPLPADAPRPRAGADLRGSPTHWLGAAPHRRGDGPSTLDRPPHPRPPRTLTPAPSDPRGHDPLRVAMPGRPPAHGHQALCALRAARAPGDRRPRQDRGREAGALGYEFAHSIVDDHSRVAYSELHPDERAATVAAFTRRALAFFAALGIEPKRLMTDNAFVYTRSSELAELLSARGIRHLTIEPRRPQTNGKVERFQQTMAREWAYGLTYRTSSDRARALPHWLDYYNRRRPHSGIGDRPPISRVHDVSGQDT
jgi:transposase InsO family protein